MVYCSFVVSFHIFKIQHQNKLRLQENKEKVD